MAGYDIFFKASVWKELRKLPKNDLKKIIQGLKNLESILGPSAVKNS